MIIKFEYTEGYINLDNCTEFEFVFSNPITFEYKILNEETTRAINLTVFYDISHWEEFRNMLKESFEGNIIEFEGALDRGDKYFLFPEF